MEPEWHGRRAAAYLACAACRSAHTAPSPACTHYSKHRASSQSVMEMGELVAAKLPHFQETRRSASVPAPARAAVRIASFQLHQGLTCGRRGRGAAGHALHDLYGFGGLRLLSRLAQASLQDAYASVLPATPPAASCTRRLASHSSKLFVWPSLRVGAALSGAAFEQRPNQRVLMRSSGPEVVDSSSATEPSFQSSLEERETSTTGRTPGARHWAEG